jgi:hypothetical protein
MGCSQKRYRSPSSKGYRSPSRPALGDAVSTKGLTPPTWEPAKEFFRFTPPWAVERSTLKKGLTFDLLNTFAEWFFTGFTRVTGMPTDEGDRSEIYKVGTLPRHRLSRPLRPVEKFHFPSVQSLSLY